MYVALTCLSKVQNIHVLRKINYNNLSLLLKAHDKIVVVVLGFCISFGNNTLLVHEHAIELPFCQSGGKLYYLRITILKSNTSKLMDELCSKGTPFSFSNLSQEVHNSIFFKYHGACLGLVLGPHQSRPHPCHHTMYLCENTDQVPILLA